MLFFAATMVVWIVALVDCIRSEMKTEDKLIWVLVILIGHFVGAIIYFIMKGQPIVKSNKRLYRKDGVIAGVCEGLGDYFGIDPVLIRLLWVFVILFSAGLGILAYVLAAIIIPKKERN